MGEFSPQWLSMREPFDHAARDAGLLSRLQSHLSSTTAGPVRVVDLGCGHGSNLRYLAPRLPGPQQWRLIDHDPVLLEWISTQPAPAEAVCTTERHDLRLALDALPLQVDVVVCSALLDLVSLRWLESLARRCLDEQLPLLAVLSVDGRVSWQPAAADDSDVMRWFRAHQLGDRGFGPSPGVGAVDVLSGLLEAGGMRVYTAAADWKIGPEHPEMLAEMARGIAHASTEMSPRPAAVSDWLSARLSEIKRGEAQLTVGHRDLLALPVLS